MWETLAKALCLVLILEGILPFLYPARWRAMLAAVARASDSQLRTMGLVLMLLGLGLLTLIS